MAISAGPNIWSPDQFVFDFTPFLTGSILTLTDSISTVTWTIPSQLSSSSQTNDTTTATIVIGSVSSTGVLDTQYILGCAVVTTNGQNLTLNVPVLVTAVAKFPGVLD
jgi:hypothetical protein